MLKQEFYRDARHDLPGPLAGVRVLEATTTWAGPMCGCVLADFGAEVIKVEDPAGGDPMRQWGPRKVDGLSLHWPIIARNKKSVTANLRQEEGQRLLRELAAVSDILIENFRPGMLERWDLGYETLVAANPRLILVRVSGYGQSGPYALRAGFGSVGEAMGGIRYVTGEPDRAPSRTGISLGDSLAATFAAVGAILALYARDRTGRGQVVDSAIYEAVLALMESVLPEWELAGYQRERTGSVLPGVAPSNVYPAADGGGVLIGANRPTGNWDRSRCKRSSPVCRKLPARSVASAPSSASTTRRSTAACSASARPASTPSAPRESCSALLSRAGARSSPQSRTPPRRARRAGRGSNARP